MYIPSVRSKPSPVVLMLHGAGGNSLLAAEQTEWCTKAEADGFIVAFPNGTPFDPNRPTSFLRNPQVWNSGVERGVGRVSNVDDVGFIKVLINYLATTYAIDETQVFAAGFSNGGGMCWRLAIELSDKLAAVAAVCSYLTVDEPWHQARAVPAIFIACLDDPLVPIDGGQVKDIWSRVEIFRPSVRTAVEKYATFIGCSAEHKTTDMGNGVTKFHYRPGNGGSMVEFYTVAEAGHAYPGGPRLLSERIAGKSSNAINATDLIWQFFKNVRCATGSEVASSAEGDRPDQH